MPCSCLVVEIKSGAWPHSLLLSWFLTSGGKTELLEEGSGHPRELNNSGFMGHQSAREQADRHVETTARRTPTEWITAKL